MHRATCRSQGKSTFEWEVDLPDTGMTFKGNSENYITEIQFLIEPGEGQET